MARRKAKVYNRFNFGVFLKEKRRLRDEAAKTHKVLVKQKAKLSNLIRKVSILMPLTPPPHPLPPPPPTHTHTQKEHFSNSSLTYILEGKYINML